MTQKYKNIYRKTINNKIKTIILTFFTSTQIHFKYLNSGSPIKELEESNFPLTLLVVIYNNVNYESFNEN